jgi:hypothetical protein
MPSERFDAPDALTTASEEAMYEPVAAARYVIVERIGDREAIVKNGRHGHALETIGLAWALRDRRAERYVAEKARTPERLGNAIALHLVGRPTVWLTVESVPSLAPALKRQITN